MIQHLPLNNAVYHFCEHLKLSEFSIKRIDFVLCFNIDLVLFTVPTNEKKRDTA